MVNSSGNPYPYSHVKEGVQSACWGTEPANDPYIADAGNTNNDFFNQPIGNANIVQRL
jgi:hypothetical protein